MKNWLNTLLFPFKGFRKVREGSYWTDSKKEFYKNRRGVVALRILYVLIFIAVLADFLANEKPLAAGINGQTYFPVVRSYAVQLGLAGWPKELQNLDWSSATYDWNIFPPIPYSAGTLDKYNIHSVSPWDDQQISSWRWRHWLGTDELGRDVLSGLIHGTRISLSVGIIAMGIAAFLGILIGSLAGYFGDSRLKMRRGAAILLIAGLVMGTFWAFISRSHILADALHLSFIDFVKELCISLLLFAGAILAARSFAWPLKFIPMINRKIVLPVDMVLSRFIEIMVSVPTLFLIISISAIVAEPSIYIVMAIIGLTSWTGIARFIRAEMLRIRSLEYMEAAHALGYPEWRMIFRHAIPNALSPVLITIAFGVAAAILTESTLTFLGVGVSAETVTWGSLLAEARHSPSAWWLALLPGCAIFMTVTIFNLLGEALTDALDPRLRK